MVMQNNEGNSTSQRNNALGSDSWSETALAWWQRSRQQRKVVAPTNPSAAARAFVQRPGLPFLQTATSRPQSRRSMSRYQSSNANKRQRLLGRTHELPLIELSGPVAKTSTILALAAQFVVRTRPSRFHSIRDSDANETESTDENLPQVFILDSHWDISSSDMNRLIRSSLLCDYDSMATDVTTREDQNSNDEVCRDDLDRLVSDCQCCLERVHLAYADENNSSGWLPIWESLASHLAEASLHHPTLVLCDGLLDSNNDSVDGGAEIQRAILRLLRDYNVMLVYTTRKALPRKKNEWDARVTHRIALDAAPPGTHGAFVAYSDSQQKGNPIAFSITTAGLR